MDSNSTGTIMQEIITESCNTTYPQSEVFALYYAGQHGTVILGVFGSETRVREEMDKIIKEPWESMDAPGIAWSRVPLNALISDMDLSIMLDVLREENEP